MSDDDPQKKPPNSKKKRGTPRKQPRGVRLLTEKEQAYGWPTRLSRRNDLSDSDILDGIVADSAIDGWFVNGKRLPPPFRGSAELQPSMIREIHLFVCRVIKTNKKKSSVPAYYISSNGGYAETVIGSDYLRIESALRVGLPTEQDRYSEHVRLFLDGYQAFGLDGSVSVPGVISKYAGSSRRHQDVVNGFVEWIREKYLEKIERPKMRIINPAGYPVFPMAESSKLDRKKAGKSRNSATGRFEFADDPVKIPPNATVIFPTVDGRVVDNSFQTRLRRRRVNPTKNNRKASKLVERIFQRVEAVRVIHIDVGVRPEFVGKSRVQAVRVIKEFLKVYFNYGVKNSGPFRGMVGRIAKLAQTRDRGYFCRIIFIFESSVNSSFVGLADRLGSTWVEGATGGRGVYSIVGPGASRFRLEPKGPIRRFDPQARISLLRAIRYLTVADEYLRPDLSDREISFFASDLPLEMDPAPTKRGNDTIQDYAYAHPESQSATEESSSPVNPPDSASNPDVHSPSHSTSDVAAVKSDATMHEPAVPSAADVDDLKEADVEDDISDAVGNRAEPVIADESPSVVVEIFNDYPEGSRKSSRNKFRGKRNNKSKKMKRSVSYPPMYFDNDSQ